jgi:two-component system, NtrC family, sensor histidine kinase PilS
MANSSAARSIDAPPVPDEAQKSRTIAADQPAGSRWNRTVADSLWTSLRYFNVYRLIIAAFFTVVGLASPIGTEADVLHSRVFVMGSLAYVSVTMVFHLALVCFRRWFSVQLTFHVVADILAITLLMHASTGFRSGLGVMLLISLAGAALVADRVLPLLFASMATIAILVEQFLWMSRFGANANVMLQPAILGVGYFVTSLVTNWLAHRVISNETIALNRGIELANQIGVNALVIRDLQDGVIVVDEQGFVRQANRRADALLGRSIRIGDALANHSRSLAAQIDNWVVRGGDVDESTLVEGLPLRVRARFQRAGVEDRRFTVVFLEDLSRLEEAARQVKLVALGRLTANIAHEIRNPLSAITHAADLMLEENRAQGRERLARIMRDNAYRLDRMVSDVLELNRRDRVLPEAIALASFIRTFVADFAQQEDKNAEAIHIDCAADVMVNFDRVHLTQILWNLLRNAWRYAASGPEGIRIFVSKKGGRVELNVLDDGPGVPEDLRMQLFEPFFTTDSKGTGLGLYISRELAEANGARLDYLPGQAGAHFRLQCVERRT